MRSRRPPVRLGQIVVSSPSQASCEDVVGFRDLGDRLDMWVIDGATSVSERPDRVVPGISDPAWFARALSCEIWRCVLMRPLARSDVADILARLCTTYRARGGKQANAYEPPAAAMTYISLRRRGRGVRVTGIAYADCFLEVMHLPFAASNVPEPVQIPVAPGRVPGARLDRSPSSLARLQDRRIEVIHEGRGGALTIFPQSAARGCVFSFDCASPAFLALGSDGFARMWTEYGLASKRECLMSLARHGPARAMARLRAWERENPDHRTAPKSADDASIATLAVGTDPQGMQRWRQHCRDGTLTLTPGRNGVGHFPAATPGM